MSSFSKFLKNTFSPARSDSQRCECCICLEVVEAHGGGPIITPGCCGKAFHLSCLTKITDSKCPACRQLLDPSVLPPQPPSIHQRPRLSARFSPLDHNPTPIVLRMPSNIPLIPRAYSGPPRPQPIVNLSSDLEFQEIGFSGRSPFYARVSIKYSDVIDSSDASSLKIEKIPLDLVCVLDVSGSMSGSRIANLQQAMEFIIDSLSANDRLSIVTFNHQAVMAQGLVFMGGAEATAAKALIASLLSGGGTYILAGMRSGAAVLSGRADRNPCSCMFLLTDGQDGSNIPEKLALAEELRVSGTSLFTFGFGADHDSDQMSKIAQAAEGSFIFVESNDTIVDAFGGAIGSLQGQGLSDVTLTISAAPAVSILDASCGRYRTTKAADGQSVAITFANLYAGESREVLVALGVPPITDSTIERVDTYPLIGIKATYRTDSGSDSDLIAIPESVVTVRRVLDAQLDPTVKANQAVEVQRLGKDITAAIIEARKHADDGGFDKAKQVLSTARDVLQASNSYTAGQQVAVGLEMDINTALSQVSDGAAYNSRGGRAEMADICSTLGAQRKVYSKAGSSRTFQTSSSSAYQTVATNSKFR